MTKIAFISDLHIEFRQSLILPILDGQIDVVLPQLGFPETVEADVIVIAGDAHPNKSIRDRFFALLKAHYNLPVVDVNGNHDHYGSAFPSMGTGDLVTINGTKIATATLWTHLAVLDGVIAPRFADFQHIMGVTVERWNSVHQDQVAFLRQARADVIVTHHAPCPLSIHEKYRGNDYNCFFASNLPMDLYEGVKLWIHGHVHNPFDYLVDGIRIACNPLGYPFERHHYAQLKVIEV